MLRAILCLISFLVLSSCGEPVPKDGGARILVIGDSMFASNRSTGSSVADVIEAALAVKTVDRAVPGARYFYALPISGAAGLRLTAQYRPGDWDVIVVNGGGNDLLFGCGCGKCDGVLNRLISPDGRTGAIPGFVATLRESGAHVVYSGYLRNPGIQTPVKACGPAGNELDRRLARLDALDEGMTFLKMSDIVPHGDTSYHMIDLIHPSDKGSRAIGLRIARFIATLKD